MRGLPELFHAAVRIRVHCCGVVEEVGVGLVELPVGGGKRFASVTRQASAIAHRARTSRPLPPGGMP
jgi:hypothetical protein